MATSGREEELGFTIKPRQTRRIGPKVVTDLDFADDIGLISNTAEQAQKLWKEVEKAAFHIWMPIKPSVYSSDQNVEIHTLDGSNLEAVNDFKYLGSWIGRVRKALAWNSCNALDKVWKSSLPRKIEERLFLANVESVFLCGAETWTITYNSKKSLDGCYTRMLWSAFNISWKDKITNQELYDDLPPLSDKIKERRLRLTPRAPYLINRSIMCSVCHCDTWLLHKTSHPRVTAPT